jgi:oligopeptide/dipeptide ABC transporter ATP-binding protein
MYAGQIVEQQASATLHARPRHPYSSALVGARPDVSSTAPRLTAIPGQPLSAFDAPPGCAFAPRCPLAIDACTAERPELRVLGDATVRCIRAEELVHD